MTSNAGIDERFHPRPAPRKAVSSVSVTIPAGASLSNSADLTGGAVNFVIAPSDWDDSLVSFQVSTDNISFYDLFDRNGFELQRVLIPGVVVSIDPSLTAAAVYLKIRSGSRVEPNTRSVDSTFVLVLA